MDSIKTTRPSEPPEGQQTEAHIIHTVAQPTAQGNAGGGIVAPSDHARLEALETVIARGLQTFVEVGKALAEIRDRHLYRATHRTFDDYCRQRWEMDRTYAHRTIAAAKVAANLLPIGNAPTVESQTRPLVQLPPDQQRKAWTIAVSMAKTEDRPVTAKDVQAAANQIRARIDSPVKPAATRASSSTPGNGSAIEWEEHLREEVYGRSKCEWPAIALAMRNTLARMEQQDIPVRAPTAAAGPASSRRSGRQAVLLGLVRGQPDTYAVAFPRDSDPGWMNLFLVYDKTLEWFGRPVSRKNVATIAGAVLKGRSVTWTEQAYDAAGRDWHMFHLGLANGITLPESEVGR